MKSEDSEALRWCRTSYTVHFTVALHVLLDTAIFGEVEYSLRSVALTIPH